MIVAISFWLIFKTTKLQEFTDFLAKNHRAAGVQKQEARAY